MQGIHLARECRYSDENPKKGEKPHGLASSCIKQDRTKNKTGLSKRINKMEEKYMITYNVREESYKSHPLDGHYGVMISGPYINYPITIVDNHEESENGKHTGKKSACLLHLNEKVRQYKRLALYEDFLYLSFAREKPTYRMFDYKSAEISIAEAIATLQEVLYFEQPELESRTLMGWRGNNLEDDPNRYTGRYVLNDEEDYTIIKEKDQYWLYKISFDRNRNELIFEGKLNFDIYRKSVEHAKLKRTIVHGINRLLDEGAEASLTRYLQLSAELKELLKTEKK